MARPRSERRDHGRGEREGDTGGLGRRDRLAQREADDDWSIGADRTGQRRDEAHLAHGERAVERGDGDGAAHASCEGPQELGLAGGRFGGENGYRTDGDQADRLCDGGRR